MADTVGIHVSDDGIAAVRVDAVAGDEPVVVHLGADGPVDVCAVARTDDGAVLVGEAARRAEGTLETDPLGAAAGGRIGALGAVVNHVVGRAAAQGDTAPRRVAVVVPDDFDVTARDRVVAAGAAGGVTDTVVVPLGAAATAAVPDELDPIVALAAGAARVASLAAAPIVTREDLGEPIAPRPPQPAVPPITGDGDGGGDGDGPVSVFDEPARPDPGAEPGRPDAGAGPAAVGAAVGASVGASTARPVTPPMGAPPVPPVPPAEEALRYEPPGRRVPLAVVIAAALILLIAVVGGAVVLLDGDDTTSTTASTTVPPTSPPTTVPATTVSPTTVPPPSTSDPATPSTEPPTTTTASTTTSTTSSTTTTTTPVAVGEPGVVTLVETGLRFDDGELVLFEQDAEVVIAAMVLRLGDPDRDDGYEVNEFCFGARTRLVRWGDLELAFTEEELDTEVGRFTQWYADGADDPEGLVTISGVGVTGTVGLLEVRFGSSLVLVEAIEGEPDGLFAVTNPATGAVLNGTTTSLEPSGVVTALWAGDSCTRIFV